MQTVINTPLEVFNMPQYLEIPLFQRQYVWKQDDQWEPLWADIRRMTELRLSQPTTKARHFLGAIVLQTQEQSQGAVTTYEVIDGQQRLTTLQLVYDAAGAVFSGHGFSSFATQLRHLTHNDESFVGQGKSQLKLRHTNKDRDAFVEAMTAEAPVDYSSLRHKTSRIALAHEYFAGEVSRWLLEAPEEERASRAAGLVGVLTSGLQVVAITLTNEENSQEIFETLNARGTPLTAADLIRNFVFQRLNYEGADTQAAYEKSWPFDVKFWEEETSVGRYTVSRSSLFLNQWLVARTGEEVSLQSTFSRFKHFIEHDAAASMVEILGQLKSESEQYCGWQEAAESSDRRLDPTQMCFYRMLALDTHMLKPLLLWLHTPERRLPPEQVSRAVRAAESWMVRRAILRLNSADSSRIIGDLIRSLAGSPDDEVGERVENYLTMLRAVSTYWPGDAELERALTAEPVYKKLNARRLRPVLEAIENSMRAETGGEQVTRWSLAIEHILPQAWPQNWPVEGPEAESTRAAVVHRLGNLTLLTKRLNSKVSNQAWASKRQEFQSHNTLLLNSRMLAAVGAGTWDEAHIEHRSEHMVRAVLTCWPVPRGHLGEVDGGRSHNQGSVSVGDLVVAGLIAEGARVRLGRKEFAHVTAVICDDGGIELDGVRHSSPSGAGWVAMRRPTNGWYDWVLDDGRRLDDVRATYLGKAQAESRAGFDWTEFHALLGAVPAGKWTTYGALAEAVGTAAQTVASHLTKCTTCPNPHRVLQTEGRVAVGFSWADAGDTRDPRALLESEGLHFDQGKADPDARLTSEDLLRLSPGTGHGQAGIGFFRVSVGKNAAHLDEAVAGGFVGVNWLADRDLTDMLGLDSRTWHEQLNEAAKLSDGLESEVAAGLAVGQTWVLVDQIQEGDCVLVPTGRSSYRVAIVVGPYEYVAGSLLPHRRPVEWLGEEIPRQSLSDGLKSSLQFAGTVQNLADHAPELLKLVTRA